MSYDDMSLEERASANDLRRRAYAKDAPRYDKRMGFFERRVFGAEHRSWACSRAVGNTLEVAVGTGLNLPHYPENVRLTGLDLSPEMLVVARARADELRRPIKLQEGDAQELPFSDATFDTVLCTYSLCSVPDVERAIAEMKRVLRRDGQLILVDHVRSTVRAIYWVQRAVEFFSLKKEGEHHTRRPYLQTIAAGFEVQERERMRAGVVERLVALKPSD